MPLYEYQCAKCGKVFEIIQKFSDEPLTIHEGCGGEVVRLWSTPAFQFKGSGFYITDYAKSGSAPKTDSKSETKSDTGSETKSETKTESKSETKSESKPKPAPATD